MILRPTPMTVGRCASSSTLAGRCTRTHSSSPTSSRSARAPRRDGESTGDHDDRYAFLAGELELVLYDERPDFETFGLEARLFLSGAAAAARHDSAWSLACGEEHRSGRRGRRELSDDPVRPCEPRQVPAPTRHGRASGQARSGMAWLVGACGCSRSLHMIHWYERQCRGSTRRNGSRVCGAEDLSRPG